MAAGEDRRQHQLDDLLLPDDHLRDAVEYRVSRALELAEGSPERLLALITLKSEHDQNEGRLKEAEASILRGLELAGDERRKALLVVQRRSQSG